jgi:ankyrin repeat protein
MNSAFDELMVAFEVHSPERILAVLNAGYDVKKPVNGLTPINALIEMYLRSDRFPACLRLLLQHGATLDDPVLLPVLLNDPDALSQALRVTPDIIHHRTSLRCAFTPLRGASLLHVAAEYGHLDVARVLLNAGVPVDVRTDGPDAHSPGHTPLFHTVNSNANRSAPVMHLLLDAGAQCDVLLPQLTWGEGYEWVTPCFDVTPISYAQLGLLRQMQRSEAHVYDNIRALLHASGRVVPPLTNVPNRYLQS